MTQATGANHAFSGLFILKDSAAAQNHILSRPDFSGRYHAVMEASPTRPTVHVPVLATAVLSFVEVGAGWAGV
ncbi:MAG: hypothetical protein ACK5SI_10470, partial [Planctomycetia bacterium]